MNATYIDLTHTIADDMSLFPGTPLPVIKTIYTIAHDGFTEKQLTLTSHTGTHIDAPAHIIEGGITLNDLPIDSFIGKGICLSITDTDIITTAHITAIQEQLQHIDFLLIHTGWSEKWNTPVYQQNFPVFTTEAAKMLTQFNLKGIGIDTLSPDLVDSIEIPVHKILLEKGILIIENLSNLHLLKDHQFLFHALPLKTKNADGAPVRAFAMIKKTK